MIRILFVLIVTITFSACTSNKPYRTYIKPVSDLTTELDVMNNSIIQTRHVGDDNEHEYNVMFIEFNDQGAIQSKELADAALDHLESLTQEPSITLIYTHGWKHSARYDKDDVKDFHSLLGRIAAQQADVAESKRLKVNGVFLGWRGYSALTPFSYHLFSFWDRKASAHKVGFGATPVFLQIEKIAKQNERNKLITIGHSFGGAATYSGLAPILQERYISSRGFDKESGEPKIVEGFGDIVVLLNPAFEASIHMPLYELTQDNCRAYNKAQPVRLLTIASQDDTSVRWALPAAQYVSNFFTERTHSKKPFTACQGVDKKVIGQTYDEGYAIRTSPGNLSASVTHCLQFKGDKFYIKDKNIVVDHNPYITLQDSGKTIKNHSDIWNDKVVNIVTSILENNVYTNEDLTIIENDQFYRSSCPKGGS